MISEKLGQYLSAQPKTYPSVACLLTRLNLLLGHTFSHFYQDEKTVKALIIAVSVVTFASAPAFARGGGHSAGSPQAAPTVLGATAAFKSQLAVAQGYDSARKRIQPNHESAYETADDQHFMKVARITENEL
jgi:hypothetical protein